MKDHHINKKAKKEITTGQGPVVLIMKKEFWREADVLELPAGEQDYFERKSGAILTETDWRDEIAKGISAFANAGGGHLILDVQNDGSIDGVPRIHKGYPLQDFR